MAKKAALAMDFNPDMGCPLSMDLDPKINIGPFHVARQVIGRHWPPDWVPGGGHAPASIPSWDIKGGKNSKPKQVT